VTIREAEQLADRAAVLRRVALRLWRDAPKPIDDRTLAVWGRLTDAAWEMESAALRVLAGG